MSEFQGSGFSIALPENCIDASSYTFVLEELNGFSANLTIRFQLPTEGFSVSSFLDEQIATLSTTLDSFSLSHQANGKRGEIEGAMCTYEWGQGSGRFKQKQVVMLSNMEPARVYIMVSTDLASNADQSDPVFEQMMRSFVPNDTQLW